MGGAYFDAQADAGRIPPHRVRRHQAATEYLLREAKRRAHILEGQLIAISSLDEVIAICRARRVVLRPRSACRISRCRLPARPGSGSRELTALQSELA